MKTWRDKAHVEIGKLCYQEWRKTNIKKDGTQYKKHRPYVVPEMAERLIDALNIDDEKAAKAIFLYELRSK